MTAVSKATRGHFSCSSIANSAGVMQNPWSQTLWLLIAVAVALVCCLAALKLPTSPQYNEATFATVDYACQVGNGAIDCPNAPAITRLSASQVARTACDILHAAVDRYAVTNCFPHQMSLFFKLKPTFSNRLPFPCQLQLLLLPVDI